LAKAKLWFYFIIHALKGVAIVRGNWLKQFWLKPNCVFIYHPRPKGRGNWAWQWILSINHFQQSFVLNGMQQFP